MFFADLITYQQSEGTSPARTVVPKLVGRFSQATHLDCTSRHKTSALYRFAQLQSKVNLIKLSFLPVPFRWIHRIGSQSYLLREVTT
jgi:hypothetical protein